LSCYLSVESLGESVGLSVVVVLALAGLTASHEAAEAEVAEEENSRD